jgi:hypothetical protein
MTSILAVAYKGTKKTQWHVSCYEVNGILNPHRFSAPIQFNHSPSSYRGNILHHESPFPGREYRMSYPADTFGENPDFGGFGTEGADFGGAFSRGATGSGFGRVKKFHQTAARGAAQRRTIQ